MKVRIIIESRTKSSICQHYDQVLFTMDLRTAFLQAEVAAEAFLPQPEGVTLRTIIEVTDG